MFVNYPTMTHHHMHGDVGFFDARGDEEAFLKSKPPLSQEIFQSYKPKNPWQSSPTFDEDFVLVCEFSELEGPKPVMTIPKEAGGDFDLNDFALKIMAIDYNATNVVRSGGTFSLVEDTGVVLEESKESAFAYVHHFTLYDVIARGYVRPFCIAYITSDKRKLIRNLEWLMTQFGKVSESFRYGNRRQFQIDLQCRLADIRYTIEDLKKQRLKVNSLKQVKASDGKETDADEHKSKLKLAALERGIREVQDIVELLQQESVNPKLESLFKKLEQLSCGNSPCKPRRHRHSSNVHEDGYRSDGEEKHSVGSSHRRIRRISTCDSLRDLQSSLELSAQYTPQIIRLDGYRKFDIRLRTLHELCGWGYKAALGRVRKLHTHLCRNPLILYMEKKEAKLVEPTSALLSIGRTVVLNFMQDISWDCLSNIGTCRDELEKPCNAQLQRFASNVSTSSTSPTLDEPLLMYEARFMPGTAYASMESLYYDVNESLEESSDDEFDDNISEISKKFVGNGVFITSEDGSWLDLDINSKDLDYSSSAGTQNSLKYKGKHMNGTDGTPSDEVDVSTVNRDVTSSDHVADSNSTFSTRGDQVQDSTLSTSNADTYTIRRHQKVTVGSYASRINSFNRYLPGSGVRNMIGQYSFAVHLIYALLSGRTVIIVSNAHHEKEVTTLIRTLWLFVPGHSSLHHLVVPWHTQPLCLSDLNRMKLVGLARHKSSSPCIPPDVQELSSILDYDKSTLWTPPYKGVHLNDMVKTCRHFRSDQACIAYIHSRLLELAQNAFVYYHSFCMNSPNFQLAIGNDASRTGRDQMRNGSISYLSRLGITDGDVDVIEHWVDIIKQQQIDEWYLQASSAVIPPPCVRSDQRQCQMYQA